MHHMHCFFSHYLYNLCMQHEKQILKSREGKRKMHHNDFRSSDSKCIMKRKSIVSQTLSLGKTWSEATLYWPLASINLLSAISFNLFWTSAGWRADECCCFKYITSFPPIFIPTIIWVPKVSMNLGQFANVNSWQESQIKI